MHLISAPTREAAVLDPAVGGGAVEFDFGLELEILGSPPSQNNVGRAGALFRTRLTDDGAVVHTRDIRAAIPAFERSAVELSKASRYDR